MSYIRTWTSVFHARGSDPVEEFIGFLYTEEVERLQECYKYLLVRHLLDRPLLSMIASYYLYGGVRTLEKQSLYDDRYCPCSQIRQT